MSVGTSQFLRLVFMMHSALSLPCFPQTPQGLKHNTCMLSLLDYVFKKYHLSGTIIVFKASPVLFLLVMPKGNHEITQVCTAMWFFFPVWKILESPFMYLTYLTLAKLKTVPQKHTVIYPTSKCTHSQNREVLKRITKVHLGAGDVHNKAKAKIKYHCHKLYQLWNSQSQPFAAEELLVPRYKSSDTQKEMVIGFLTSTSWCFRN